MNLNRNKINPIWVKASMLGSIWGTIEIIIGSFLHNLRIPMTGTILSAIAVSILVGGHLLWKEKGLIWRAGLVCALMKSISPSAVIIGPMIGIFSEAIFLELFIRISRGTTAGLIIGGAVAVSLPFVQSIISLIITYGFNIALLYTEIYKIIAKNIGIQNITLYEALGIFLSVHAFIGIIAALFGISVAKQAIVTKDTISRTSPTSEGNFTLPPVNQRQKFSLTLLSLNLLSVPLLLLVIGSSILSISSIIVLTYISIMIFLYPFAWRRFLKPKLWIEMILITVISGFLLSEIVNKNSGWNWSGILIGLEMSVRAIFMIAAFNVISIELRNPIIIEWVLKRGFGQIATALEAAFAVLPSLVSTLGEQKHFFRHPVSSLARLFNVAKLYLDNAEMTESIERKIIILTGDRGSGKTTLLIKLVEELQKQNRVVGGILSPVVMDNSARIGYDVINVQTGNRTALCRNNLESSGPNIGDLNFFENGIRFGIDAIQASLSNCELIIIDEVGPLELDGEVWAQAIDRLMNLSSCPVLFVVREHLIEKVKSRWSFVPLMILKLKKNNSEEILTKLINLKTVLPIS